MKTIESITTYNGNGQPMTKELPLISIISEHLHENKVVLAHILENTGLNFEKGMYGILEAQPETSDQIARLFLTYNFKTEYHDNSTNKNTLFLKICRSEGFKTETLCLDCVKRNHIHVGSLKEGDLLRV